MARDGDASVPSLEAFRNYLELLARARMDPRLRGKLDPADLVQQALLRAVEARDRFRGDDAGRAAWLRTILARVMIDAVRKFGRPGGGERERSLEAALEHSRRGLRRSWPRTRRRPAAGPSGTNGCSAWPTPWPGCRRTGAGPSSCGTSTACPLSRSPRRWAGASTPWWG